MASFCTVIFSCKPSTNIVWQDRRTNCPDRKKTAFRFCAGDRSEENLSDGQTQRLSLARGFLKDAEVIMMDEPTSGENLNVFFVRPLFTLRMMILPGQARDKDRESSTQRTNTGFLLQRWTLLLRGVLSTV